MSESNHDYKYQICKSCKHYDEGVFNTESRCNTCIVSDTLWEGATRLPDEIRAKILELESDQIYDHRTEILAYKWMLKLDE